MERECSAVQLSIVIPTRNEAGNVAELVRRIEGAVRLDPRLSLDGVEAIFVDDSTDDTPGAVRLAARTAALRVSCVHREEPAGGLGGAVLLGARLARSDRCLVMDGDLQHPPEMIGKLFARLEAGDGDVIVASRYTGDGTAGGLASSARRAVSNASTLLVKAMFPGRLHGCSDPMTGFFAFDRRRIDLDGLRPQGFKILLEMLARQELAVAEVPFDFGERRAGASKASLRQGWHFLRQLVQLRFGRMSGFALVGAAGAVVNIALVWLLTGLGLGTLAATTVAAEATIVGNFLVQDRFVFGDIRGQARGFRERFARSFLFNNAEAVIRIGLVLLLVDRGWMGAATATALLLAIAFVIRYAFHALVVYAPK